MTSPELERLAEIGALKPEPPSRREYEGLVRSAAARLKDAAGESLSLESRFDLAYNASHALALAALRRMGYRSGNRYLVFQALPHTVGFDAADWRFLSKCHERRNLAEYEGIIDLEEQLVVDLLRTAEKLLVAVSALPPPPQQG
jgi:hypothetical protein